MEEFDWDTDCGHGELGRRVVLELLAEFRPQWEKLGFQIFTQKVRFLDFSRVALFQSTDH
jgi:hypothetical protein